VPQLAGYVKDVTGSLDYAFYLSGGVLIAAVITSRVLRRPLKAGEQRENARTSTGGR
jgi:OFA family oxalate/formate antiporter-like MFS transporter